jgi:hypothetical protein
MKQLTTLDELDAAIIPVTETRICDKCKTYTWWAAKGQRTLGRCLTCMKLPMTDELAAAAQARAESMLATVFPDAEPVPPPKPMKAGVYAQRGEVVKVTLRWIVSGQFQQFIVAIPPRDAGPCVDCRGIIRRYGPGGMMRCADCAEKASCQS